MDWFEAERRLASVRLSLTAKRRLRSSSSQGTRNQSNDVSSRSSRTPWMLTGKKDPITNEHIGYRTRIVHLGNRLDQLLPEASDRVALFEELDGVSDLLNEIGRKKRLPYTLHVSADDRLLALFQPTISHAAVVTSVGVRSAPQR